MPRGMNPKSLENLKKGKRFRSDDGSARINGDKGKRTQAQMRTIAEEMREILTLERRKALGAKLVLNMEKNPEWYKLGLRMIGELPPEQVEVSKPKTAMSDEVESVLAEIKKDVSKNDT